MAAELANSQDDRNPIKQKERQKGRPLFYFKFYSERLGVKLRSMSQCPARSCDLRLLRTQALKHQRPQQQCAAEQPERCWLGYRTGVQRQRVRQNLVTGTLDADVFIVFKRGRQHEQDITESGAARKKHRARIAQSVRSKDCKRLSRLYAIDNHASGCQVERTGSLRFRARLARQCRDLFHLLPRLFQTERSRLQCREPKTPWPSR